MTAVEDLSAIEASAVELARIAGQEIVASLGRALEVRYKELGPDLAARFRDPVSEVDRNVESILRQHLAERFPSHGIIGEEIDARPARGSDFVWVVDPVDGTANFVNGFPLFSASIGVLQAGRPVVGAVWCSTGHALRPGVYHAREGGLLLFEGEAIEAVDRSQVKRRIVAVPRTGEGAPLGYEARQTGSAAIECAFVAAGLLSGARFAAPNIWDVAGGIPLVRATKCQILTRAAQGEERPWKAFDSFAPAFEPGPAIAAEPNPWRQELIIGEQEASSALAADAG